MLTGTEEGGGAGEKIKTQKEKKIKINRKGKIRRKTNVISFK